MSAAFFLMDLNLFAIYKLQWFCTLCGFALLLHESCKDSNCKESLCGQQSVRALLHTDLLII